MRADPATNAGLAANRDETFCLRRAMVGAGSERPGDVVMRMHVPVAWQPGPSKTRSGAGPVESGEAERRRREREVDDELAQSFPASDPPSWTMGVTPADSHAPDGPGPGVAADGTSHESAR